MGRHTQKGDIGEEKNEKGKWRWGKKSVSGLSLQTVYDFHAFFIFTIIFKEKQTNVSWREMKK